MATVKAFAKNVTNKRLISGFAGFALATFVFVATAAIAAPTATPPNGNVNANFNSITTSTLVGISSPDFADLPTVIIGSEPASVLKVNSIVDFNSSPLLSTQNFTVKGYMFNPTSGPLSDGTTGDYPVMIMDDLSTTGKIRSGSQIGSFFTKSNERTYEIEHIDSNSAYPRNKTYSTSYTCAGNKSVVVNCNSEFFTTDPKLFPTAELRYVVSTNMRQCTVYMTIRKVANRTMNASGSGYLYDDPYTYDRNDYITCFDPTGTEAQTSGNYF